MSGTFQLVMHMGLVALTLGLGLAAFPDANVFVTVFAALCWFVACFHFADAFWIPSWGRGRDLVDRIGIAIKGVGFAMISASVLLTPSIGSIAFGFIGLVVVFFGRILWELLVAGRSSLQ